MARGIETDKEAKQNAATECARMYMAEGPLLTDYALASAGAFPWMRVVIDPLKTLRIVWKRHLLLWNARLMGIMKPLMDRRPP